MSRGGGGGLENVAVALLVGNLVYLLSIVIISMIIGVSPDAFFSGPFSGAANSLVSAWVTLGALLGVVDVLAVLSFVSSVLDGF